MVDVGCGTGNAALLAAARGARVTGVFTFDDEDKIVRTEVYFGWNLE